MMRRMAKPTTWLEHTIYVRHTSLLHLQMAIRNKKIDERGIGAEQREREREKKNAHVRMTIQRKIVANILLLALITANLSICRA